MADAGVRRAMNAVLEALRPGVAASKVYDIGERMFGEEGHENYLMYVAHGVGRNVHEEPVLAPNSKWTLEANIVLSIELVTVKAHLGMIGLEDSVVITADGHEDVTTIGPELHTVSDR